MEIESKPFRLNFALVVFIAIAMFGLGVYIGARHGDDIAAISSSIPPSSSPDIH